MTKHTGNYRLRAVVATMAMLAKPPRDAASPEARACLQKLPRSTA